MICIIWNCQGAASKTFRRTLKHFCRLYSPDLVCLLEPKVSGDQANRICISFGFEEWIRVEAVGFSGGIWVFWNRPLEIQIMKTHPQFINLQITDGNSPPWVLSIVYGSPNQSLRRKLFSELNSIDFRPQTCWLACGDFNSVISTEEVSNTSCFNSSRCFDFRNWIFREGLIDMGFVGTKFTWMRGIDSSTFKGARLDRALSNANWKTRFPQAIVEHLPMINSDHSPLLVSCNPTPEVSGTRPFRFNLAWSTHEDFMNFVRRSWADDKHLEENKNAMAKALPIWNRDTFGNVFHRKKRLLARIKGVQQRLASQVRNDLLRLERKLRKELQTTLYQEELIWFQRSREEWITSGDCNTKFYHTATSIRKNRVKISSLRDSDGVWISDKNLLINHVRTYFERLFSDAHSTNPQLLPHGFFPTLTAQDWQEVNRPFRLEEIKEALSDMSSSKAQAPMDLLVDFSRKRGRSRV
ncbi:uncharacterized protein LOC116022462 [Ipomoea triloba]|uniref:uncharacterized protein LOC116022462 n=1 Tax=Ipomoea triloba TaxID=35885 RepID=UPI00125DD142|nr:uncharacterized protein LOC116022462 [Ipomoea triloba]